MFLWNAEPRESYQHGKSHSMDEPESVVVMQTTVTLPFLDDEVPAVDGK